MLMHFSFGLRQVKRLTLANHLFISTRRRNSAFSAYKRVTSAFRAVSRLEQVGNRERALNRTHRLASFC